MILKNKLSINNKVKILRKDIFHLRNRKNKNGIITNVNGDYYIVRPMYCTWEIELYKNEIKKIK